MIEELRVFAIGGIKEASLKFSGNFIVITGESGSGKSSLVRALEFAAGKRAQVNHIRTGEDQSEAQVILSTEFINNIPDEYQPQEGTFIARRTFNRNGRGRCTIQEHNVPLNILSSAMEKELVIQSQFAQLGLLDQEKQMELVDSCGGDSVLNAAKKLEQTFSDTVSCERKIIALKKKRTELEEKYQDSDKIIRLINSLQLTSDSEEQWAKEIRELERNAKTYEAVSTLSEKMSGAYEGGSLLENTEKIAREIYSALPTESVQWKESIEKMLSAAQELSKNLKSHTLALGSPENIEESKERLETKMGILRKIKRTLSVTSCAALLEYVRTAEIEITWLKESFKELDSLEKEASRLKKETSSLAMELRRLREEYALILSSKVNSHLKDLAMEHANFTIQVEHQIRVRASGAENVSFMLSLPDQTPLPVGKTASGGELSRILIALQLSLGDSQLPGTLVFDEVEAGLGGKTALLAGSKLRELSKRCRTILITHEATIAAMADQHFVVKRYGEDTEIIEINGNEREREIARMLAGDESSPEALEHAKSLLWSSDNQR